MKTVYILSGITRYEGSQIFGAFSSQKKAQKVYDDHQAIAKNDVNMWYFDEEHILKVEVDEIVFPR